MPSAALIFNAHSGRHLDSGDALAETAATLERRGITVVPMHGDLAEQIAESRSADTDIVVVSGGDGTIRATIEAHRGGRPIGILPAGTMNLLALDFGIPEDLGEAAAVIASGTTRHVDYETDCLVAAAQVVPVNCHVVEDLAWAEIDDEKQLIRAREKVYPAILRRENQAALLCEVTKNAQ